MGLLSRIFAKEDRAASARDGYLAGHLDMRGSVGAVNAERASGLAVAYRCIQLRAENIASVRLGIYRRTEDGGRELVENHPLARVLNEQCAPSCTAFESRELLSACADIHGNAFAAIERDGRGQVAALTPMLPGTVGVELLTNGRRRYRWTPLDGRERVLLQDEVLHIRHRSRDGIMGLSPMAQTRETFTLASAQADAASAMMRNGARLSGIISFPEMMKPDDMDRMRRGLADRYSGADAAGRVMVLDGGAKFAALSMSARDAEFIENRKLSNLDIARVYGVPPTTAGIPDNATYSNVEQETRAFVVRCLAPWAKRIEESMNMALLSESARKTYFIEHDLGGLLRGELGARYDAYRIGREWGWLSRNDIRRMENMSRIEDGDDYLTALNMSKDGGQVDDRSNDDSGTAPADA